MDDDHAGRATACRFFEFVGPAAVIGHRLAAEIAFAALEIGVVDEHDEDLAADVLALQVIPVAFGSRHSVTDKDQRSVVDVDLPCASESREHSHVAALANPNDGPALAHAKPR